MTTQISSLQQALALVRELSPMEKVRLVEEVMSALEKDLTNTPAPRKPLYGLLKGLDVSEEDIAEARREMWGNFPREDV